MQDVESTAFQPAMAPDRLLLVDDDALEAVSTQWALEKRGYRVQVAVNAAAAIQAVRQGDGFDLVLMDINLGAGMDGIEAARVILGLRQLPVVFLSSHVDAEAVGRTESVFSYGYVVKSNGIMVLDASIKLAYRLFLANRSGEHERTMAAVREAERSFAGLMENGPMGAASLEMVRDGAGNAVDCRFLHANGRFEEIAGTDPRGKTLRQVFPGIGDEPFDWIGQFGRVARDGGNIHFEQKMEANGHWYDYYAYQTGPDRFMAVFLDISRSKATEAELHESNTYLNNLFDHANAPIITWDPDQRISRFNHAFERLTGHAQAAVLGQPLDILFPADTRETSLALITQALQGEHWESVEIPIRTTRGAVRTVIWNSAGVRDLTGQTVSIIAQGVDITDRKLAEEEVRRNEARLKLMVDIMQHPAESTQDFLDFALAAALRLTGSVYGYIYHYHEGRRQFVLNTWSRGVMGDCAVLDPQTTYDLDKTGIWGEAVRQRRPIVVNDCAAANPLKKGLPAGHVPLGRFMTLPVYRSQAIVGVIGLANKDSDYTEADVLQVSLMMEAVWKVTERRQAEESVKKLLAEKELLLREVHHRIKNNMSTIHSLLSLQADAAREPGAVAALRDAAVRMQSMLVLYEKLYQAAGFETMSAASYLPALIQEIIVDFPGGMAVKTVFDVEDISMSVKILQPLGIIINELLTNMMKYAFADPAQGVISVSLRQDGPRIVLELADNGRGMPEGVSFTETPGFGLSLVSALVGQLHGRIRIERGGGTRFVLAITP
jgi:PAS domain S-box-containing protein